MNIRKNLTCVCYKNNLHITQRQKCYHRMYAASENKENTLYPFFFKNRFVKIIFSLVKTNTGYFFGGITMIVSIQKTGTQILTMGAL